jgi:hypothetical protein
MHKIVSHWTLFFSVPEEDTSDASWETHASNRLPRGYMHATAPFDQMHNTYMAASATSVYIESELVPMRYHQILECKS